MIKRKILASLLIVMSIDMIGCKNNSTNNKDSAKTEITVEKEQNSTDETEQMNESQVDDKINDINVADNTTKAYPGSKSVVSITMGASENGNQVALCTLKIPTDYYMASLYMDETGETQTMLETNGKLVSQIVEAGSLETLKEFCNEVSLEAPGGTDNTYGISILPVDFYSVEYEKDLTPDGLDIETKDGHAVYVCYDSSDQSDFVFAYQINDKWTLLIQNKGQLKDQMSLEDFAKEMCQLIIPIE